MRLPPGYFHTVLESASLTTRRTIRSPATFPRLPLPASKSNMSSSVEIPWHAAYPAPRNTTPDGVSPTQLLDLLSNGDERVVLVDLRRNDHEVSTDDFPACY